jgi:hypothetical protein
MFMGELKRACWAPITLSGTEKTIFFVTGEKISLVKR